MEIFLLPEPIKRLKTMRFLIIALQVNYHFSDQLMSWELGRITKRLIICDE